MTSDIIQMLKIILNLYSFHFFNIVLDIAAHDYCKLQCGSRHTICQREPCSPTSKCGTNFAILEMDSESRQWVLDKHNELRSNIASGKDTRGGNEKSANMHVLSYSKELEFIALCWATTCGKFGSHDECRSTKQFIYVGQNMYHVHGTPYFDYSTKSALDLAIVAWYDEIVDSDNSVVNSFHETGKVIGHFTQIVWAETTHVGCARVQHGKGKFYFGMYMYCNYGPGGNMLSQKVYEKGEPCTKCEPEQCNSEYPNLCGKILSGSNGDDWEAPFKITARSSRIPPFSVYSFVLCILIIAILI